MPPGSVCGGSCNPGEDQDRSGRGLPFRAAIESLLFLPRRRGAEMENPAAASGETGQEEFDGLRRCVEHDVERRLSRLQRPERIGEKAALRKIPILLRHFGRPRRQPQYAIASIGLSSAHEAAWPQLRKAAPKPGPPPH